MFLKQNFFLFLLSVAIIATSYTLSMDSPNPSGNVYIINLLDAPLKKPSLLAIYKQRNQEKKEVVEPQAETFISSLNKLDQGSDLIIGGYGDYWGTMISKHKLPSVDLINEWQILHKLNDDDLIITVDWQSRFSYALKFDYNTRTKKVGFDIPKSYNPLDLFNKIPRSLSLEEIENGKFDTIFWIPGLIYGQTQISGEKIYQYILGLPENYTRVDIDGKFKKLAIKWHPDKFEGANPADYAFATKMFRLVNKAKEELERALKTKAETQTKEAEAGWTTL